MSSFFGTSVPEKAPVIVGLDLAGSPRRPSGFCVLQGREAQTTDLFGDGDILAAIVSAVPVLVAIDAPLRLPPGRTSIHERNDFHYRPCDLELRKRKIPFFPITLGPMRGLTERGMRIQAELEKKGIRVIEIYPGGAQDIWGVPRARRDRPGLRRGLLKLGLKGLRRDASDHELDAATGALVGFHFLEGRADIYGDFASGAIVMPAAPSTWRRVRKPTRQGGGPGRKSKKRPTREFISRPKPRKPKASP